LLDQLVGQAREMSILIVIAFRPGYQAPWIGQPHVSLMALSRLNSRDSALMVNHVVSDQVLPKDVVYRIITMADGVPLFIEELGHAIFHRKNTLEGESFNIPATLSDSLTARLDQLGSNREIAQIASAIGRAFPLALLLKVAATDTADVTKAVNLLVALGLASITSTSYRDIYTFKHALIQESAYRSMMRGPRQAIHRRIAEVLEKEYAGTEDATPEILAHHYEGSGQLESAIGSLKEAGRLAAAKSANIEAANLVSRALNLAAKLPESIARDELELSLLIALGPLQISTSGPGGPESQSTYQRATELCERLPHGPHHFPAFWGWWRTAPNFNVTQERANKMSSHVSMLEDDDLRLQAHHCQWATLFNLGNQRACCAHISDGLQIYENGDYRTHGVLYGGHDPKVCALGEKSLSLWLLGYPEQSLQAANSSLTFAESLQHAGSIGHGRDIEIMVHRYRGDPTTVLNRAETMSAFALQTGSHDLAAKAKIFRGWALSWLGEVEDGVRLIQEGLDSQRAIGTQEDFPVYYEMLAESYGFLNKPALALELIDEAFDMAKRTGLQYWSAELLRRKGELLMQLSPEAAAEAAICFKQATAIAASQETRSLLLRIAMSEVRHRMTGAGETEALNTLQSVFDSFTEGFDTTDLKQAGELLRELS
jgi:predicted ATPase